MIIILIFRMKSKWSHGQEIQKLTSRNVLQVSSVVWYELFNMFIHLTLHIMIKDLNNHFLCKTSNNVGHCEFDLPSDWIQSFWPEEATGKKGKIYCGVCLPSKPKLSTYKVRCKPLHIYLHWIIYSKILQSIWVRKPNLDENEFMHQELFISDCYRRIGKGTSQSWSLFAGHNWQV